MLAWCFMLHFLYLDMQHDHVLKKVNFDAMSRVHGGVCVCGGGGVCV